MQWSQPQRLPNIELMGPPRLAITANVVLFYTGWFICVGGAGRGWGLVGPAVALAIFALHLALSTDRARLLWFLALNRGMGLIVDGGLMWLGYDLLF